MATSEAASVHSQMVWDAAVIRLRSPACTPNTSNSVMLMGRPVHGNSPRVGATQARTGVV